MKTSYSRRFNCISDKHMFYPLEDDGVTDLEQHLRFGYATYRLINSLPKKYELSDEVVPCKEIPGETVDYRQWCPKSGTPGLLSIRVSRSSINNSWDRIFKSDKLYENFRAYLKDSVQTVALKLQSTGQGDAEFNRLLAIFERAGNDPHWESRLPKQAMEYVLGHEEHLRNAK